MNWLWLEPPVGFEPSSVVLKLSGLVGPPSNQAEYWLKQQVFFDEVRRTLAAIRPPEARTTWNALEALRKEWMDLLESFQDVTKGRIREEPDLECVPELEGYLDVFPELKGRFVHLNTNVLSLASAILDERATDSSAEEPGRRELNAAARALSQPVTKDSLSKWNVLRRRCLLEQPPTVRVPTAVVNPDGIAWLECQVFSGGTDVCGPHPLQPQDAFGTEFKRSADHAWEAARREAGSTGVLGTWRYEAPRQNLGSVEGGSAGGALALAFFRALCGQKADPGVIVIASIDERGELGMVLESSIEAKVNAIIDAKVKAAGEERKIDTIAAATGHVGAIRRFLDKATRVLPHNIRVVDIAELPLIEPRV